MSWWKGSLFDTCSLITLDKLLLARPSMSRHFPKGILALEKSFSADQLRKQTVKRMRQRVRILELPAAHELASIFSTVELSSALADVDELVYAAAVHHKLSVVTADRPLGRALRDAGLRVGDFASVLRELVHGKRLSIKTVEGLLQALAERNDLLLGTPSPTWAQLEAHTFPDRTERPRK